MRSVARGQAVSTLWETKIRVLALTVACVFASTVLARVSTTSTAVPDSSLAGYDTPGKVAATADGSLAAKVPVNAPADTTATPSSSEATRSPDSGLPDAPEAKAINAYTRPGYVRPSEKSRLKNYLLGAWGPLPLVSSAMVSGITQAEGNPHEWGGGLGGYGRRWGSNYGMAAVTTTTRYGLARLTGEDTLYYRCECTGFLPRLKHAMYSTVTGRRGEDGHRIFSVPSVVAPYVGAMGSRRTQARRRERLAAAGLGEAELARLAGPAGLDLGGVTAAEAALAILAEAVAALHGRAGGRLTTSANQIHTSP